MKKTMIVFGLASALISAAVAARAATRNLIVQTINHTGVSMYEALVISPNGSGQRVTLAPFKSSVTIMTFSGTAGTTLRATNIQTGASCLSPQFTVNTTTATVHLNTNTGACNITLP